MTTILPILNPLSRGTAGSSYSVLLGPLSTTTTTTHTFQEPAGVADGDILFLPMAYRTTDTGPVALPAGWQRLLYQAHNNVATGPNAEPSMVLGWRRRLGVSELTATNTAPAIGMGRIIAYRGISSTVTSIVNGFARSTTTPAWDMTWNIGLGATGPYIAFCAIAGGQAGTWSGFRSENFPLSSGLTHDDTRIVLSDGWVERCDNSDNSAAGGVSLAFFDKLNPATPMGLPSCVSSVVAKPVLCQINLPLSQAPNI